jgi:hypothetical protein
LPKPPAGLSPESVRVWRGRFTAWWAGRWTTDDVPQLRLLIRLHDRVAQGDVGLLPELRRWLELYGITPGGQQARRWVRPEPPRPPSKLDRFLTDDHHRSLRLTDIDDT